MAATDEAAALVALLRWSDAGWNETAAEVAFVGSAVEVWRRETEAELVPDPRTVEELARARADVETWQAAGLRLVTVLDPDYPQRLLDVKEVPPFLFAAGDLRAHDRGMSVVGSRDATERGRQVAASAARLLIERGLTVIAGLAAGIDTVAHEAALAASGRTVAFLGTGINRFYPAANRHLQERIAAEGLVLSQFLPDAPPSKKTFPMRNATMSGYGLATIVVQAGEHSGTRIQARKAVEHGRPVVLTDDVVGSTTWGARLAERQGVHVVSGLSELESAVDKIVGEQDTTARALRSLAGTLGA